MDAQEVPLAEAQALGEGVTEVVEEADAEALEVALADAAPDCEALGLRTVSVAAGEAVTDVHEVVLAEALPLDEGVGVSVVAEEAIALALALAVFS